MQPIKIAVISDLHVGEKACCKALKGEAIDAESMFSEKFAKFSLRENLSPDYLLIPGDMGERARPEEMDRASALVETVLKSLNLSEDRLICIPGNHDVDWEVLKTTPVHPMRWKQRYDSIRQPQNLFQKAFARANGNLFEDPNFTFWKESKLICVGYNSSWHDSPHVSHGGKIELDHIAALRTAFEENTFKDFSGLKVFVIHHHIHQYTNYLWNETSIASNAQALLELLAEFKFDILVHGHRHFPNFMVSKTNDLHPLVVLGAGSFTREIDGDLAGIVANQFHMIEVNGRNEEGAVFGKLKNWAYLTAGGWIKSYVAQTTNRGVPIGSGIDHEKPFGGYNTRTNILTVLRPKIELAFGNGQTILDIEEFITSDIGLMHVTQDLMSEAIKDLGIELGFQQIVSSSANNRFMLKRIPK